MMNEDYQWRVLMQVDRLRKSGDHAAIARVRRLEIVAECCKEEPLIEVWGTDPPCVLARQVTYGHTDPADSERKPWSAARRGDVGVVWLSTFEGMAEQGSKQMVPCHDRRWWVRAVDVVNRRGRHVLSEADSVDHLR